MTLYAWPDAIDHLPAPADPARAARCFERLEAAGATPGALPPRFAVLLRFLAGASPYLAQLAVRDAAGLQVLAAHGPAAQLAQAIADAEACAAGTAEALLPALRAAKRKAALALACGDVSEAISLDDVTGGLTRFADACLSAALDVHLRAQHDAGRWLAADPAHPQSGSGLVIFAMGKYGAGELNYSSDIDIVAFYDRTVMRLGPGQEPGPLAVRAIQFAAQAMQETTRDGYVFRVDLRLRPDAGATQVAVSTESAALYYEGMGQNWERAAMIKARVAAGDRAAGEVFLAELRPFVWRKYLDFAAIEDIHAIKRQIHAAKGGAAIAVAGHDVKLGRGGIREIEFFAQTQQLILGGRFPALRARKTLDAIAALTQHGSVQADAAADLTAAYQFLRKLEHRIQMTADEQSHRIPADATARSELARFMGFDSEAELARAVEATLSRVARRYDALFAAEMPLGAGEGALIFTGVEDDPGTLATLSRLGFKRPEAASGLIRAWHHGRVNATRSARARELLTALKPALLGALAETPDPDAALARFDQFLSGLPAGVQLFSLLKANAWLLSVIAGICGIAPRLARHLAKTPAVLDALLEPGFLDAGATPDAFDPVFEAALAGIDAYEPMLDMARRTARELRFRVGLQLLRGSRDAISAGRLYAAIAEAALRAVFARVRQAFAAAHGQVPGGVFAILALGRLGGGEMTAASDLDLIALYDHDSEAASSDGTQPLAPSLYFARLAQRLVSAVTSLTAEGRLYEVDMRLRPSGNKGPLAVRLESFIAYQAGEAWTWERMALTRSRGVAGDAVFLERVAKAVSDALHRQVDATTIKADAAAMRARLERDKPARNPFDLKLLPGGMVDIEFIAQALQLCAASPAASGTLAALTVLAERGALSQDDADALARAYRLFSAVFQLLRLVSDDDAASLTEPGLQREAARAADVSDFAALTEALNAARADVRARFLRLIGSPA